MQNCSYPAVIISSWACFSLLNNNFKENQARALEDYIETSVMLQITAIASVFHSEKYQYFCLSIVSRNNKHFLSILGKLNYFRHKIKNLGIALYVKNLAIPTPSYVASMYVLPSVKVICHALGHTLHCISLVISLSLWAAIGARVIHTDYRVILRKELAWWQLTSNTTLLPT